MALYSSCWLRILRWERQQNGDDRHAQHQRAGNGILLVDTFIQNALRQNGNQLPVVLRQRHAVHVKGIAGAFEVQHLVAALAHALEKIPHLGGRMRRLRLLEVPDQDVQIPPLRQRAEKHAILAVENQVGGPAVKGPSFYAGPQGVNIDARHQHGPDLVLARYRHGQGKHPAVVVSGNNAGGDARLAAQGALEIGVRAEVELFAQGGKSSAVRRQNAEITDARLQHQAEIPGIFLGDRIFAGRKQTGRSLQIAEAFPELALKVLRRVVCGFLQALGQIGGNVLFGAGVVVPDGIKQAPEQRGEEERGNYGGGQFGHVIIRCRHCHPVIFRCGAAPANDVPVFPDAAGIPALTTGGLRHGHFCGQAEIVAESIDALLSKGKLPEPG